MRASDRWLTPAVLVTLIIAGALVVLGAFGCLTYLTERGIDPDPMLKLGGIVVTAVGSLGSFVLNLATRRTTTKVERNTGRLEAAVYDVADALPRPVPRHAYPDTELIPPIMNAAPGPQGR